MVGVRLLTFITAKQLTLADILSKSPAPVDGTTVVTTDVELHGISVVLSLVSERTARRVVSETASDPYLELVEERVVQGKWRIGH